MPEAIRQGDIPGVQLRCRRELPLPAGRVWPLLSEPEGLGRWLCREVRMPSAPEGELEWRGDAELGAASVEAGTLLTVDPPRRWIATLRQPEWTAVTRLEVELTETDDGCEVSVLQKGFEHLSLSISLTVWETYRRRRRAALERLAALA